jgi:hypothetical protein
MATHVKTNGVEKKAVAPKAATTKTLAKQIATPESKQSIEDRMAKFEHLRGLASQRERLVNTLGNLNKYKYNNGDGMVFLLRDETGKEFKTTNTTLIQLVSDILVEQLNTRKTEIEEQIIGFNL